MQRRRYLRVSGAALASLLAGCNDALGRGDTPTETATDTPTVTETAAPTESPTETPREEPPNVEPPQFMDLLPKEHLDGLKHTENAAFVRVDWDWYLSHYNTPMRFGMASSEDWTLEANAGNLYQKQPPQYRLLHTPVATTIQVAGGVLNLIPQWPNMGPELVRQCGFEMVNESGSMDSRATYTDAESAEVDEIVQYADPGVTYFIGVDVDSIKDALADNDKTTRDDVPDTVFYSGDGMMGGRWMFVSEAWEKPVLAVETGDEAIESIGPALTRVTGISDTESVVALESVKWCLSEFVADVPVVVGQVNGGRRKFSNTNYVVSPIRNLPVERYDTDLNGFRTSRGWSATGQVAVSNTERPVASEDTIRGTYGPEAGTLDFTRDRHVTQLTANWGT